MSTTKTVPLGQIRLALARLVAMPDDTRVMFGVGDLSLYRVSDLSTESGPGLVQIEFHERYAVTLDPDQL